MPSPSSTLPRTSLDHVHFTAVPGGESAASAAVSGTGPVGPSSSLALTLKTLTPILTSSKFMISMGATLGALSVMATLGVVLNQTGGESHSAVNITVNVTTTTMTDSSISSTSISSSPSVGISSSTVSSSQSSSASSLSSSSLTSSLSSSSTSSLSSSLSSSPSTASTVTPSTQPIPSTQPLPACLELEHTCNNGQCVNVTVLCDGIPDCDDGSDEGIPCACSSYQFTCSSGQCIPQEERCNGVVDCIDKSDEMNCSDCRGFRCASDKLCLWDSMLRKCDGVFDCDDLSDEMNCRIRPYYYRCDNSVQIPRNLRCNGNDDCRDNSDEKNCRCPFYELRCGGEVGDCIPKTLRCDGFSDCEDGADERGCGHCQSDEFQCTDYSCIPMSSRCDDKIDCHNGGADETGCFDVDEKNIVHVMINGTMIPVCSDGWKKEHSSDVCHKIQQGPVQTWINSVYDAQLYALLKPNSKDVLIQQFAASTECKSRKVVRVRCHHSDCGVRQTQVLSSFIAGGNIAPPGKWPWVASLAFHRKPICGAAIIGRRWLLTAAHCVMKPISRKADFTTAPFYFTVTAGTTSITPGTMDITNSSTVEREAPSPLHPLDISTDKVKYQTHRVAKIHLHPKVSLLTNGGVDWDLALLELDKDLHYTETVQPLCLPPEGKAFPRTSVCYVAGWGMLSDIQNIRPEKLRDTRLTLWSEDKCRRDVVMDEAEVNVNSTICAGFFFGRPTACQGDSGSPLMCLEPGSSHWVFAGIMSRGPADCGQMKPKSLANRFARVSTATSWILDTLTNT